MLVAGCGGSGATHKTTPKNGSLFEGIPQSGRVLGSPKAPYTLVEFIDLQCPFCARYDRDVLPGVIKRFVRPGKLRLEMRPIAILGQQSAPAAAAAMAASLQNRAWQFADVWYHNQPPENSGYVTVPFINRIAAAAGLDVARLERDMKTKKVLNLINDDVRVANTARLSSTPTFGVGRTGGIFTYFEGRRLERADFVRRLVAATS